jgi:putative transposase
MSWVATKLYNTAMWGARVAWDDTGLIPSGYDLYKVVRESPYFGLLPSVSSTYQGIQVGYDFRSWYALRKIDKTANPPRFRNKNHMSSVTYFQTSFRFKNDTILLSVAKGLKNELGYPLRFLPLPNIRWNKAIPSNGIIKQLVFVPENGYFNVHAKILIPEPEWRINGQVVAVDLGMRNPIVAIDEEGNIDIFKGGRILSDLRYWNKERSRVQSEIMRRSEGRNRNSNALSRMAKHGSGQIEQAIHAMTSTFVELCNRRNVKEVVVGDLRGIKKNIDGTGKLWSDKCNQNWQQFPVREIVIQLRYKLARYGIKLIEQDEAGTSKGRCSICGCTERSKLNRSHRGMFCCENCGIQLNADINGAGNQLARYLRREHSQSSSGESATPSVYHWNDHHWIVV